MSKRKPSELMTEWEVLRFVHPLGSRISGTVLRKDPVQVHQGAPIGHLTIETPSEYPALLPYFHLSDNPAHFSETCIPEVGQVVEAVVFNFVEGTLYLSAKPSDLAEEQVQAWDAFYQFLDTIKLGAVVHGTVVKAMPFGLLVDIDEPYEGLIDIGFAPNDRGSRLPRDRTAWPSEGEAIRCLLSYLRPHNRRLGLYWLPDKDDE